MPWWDRKEYVYGREQQAFEERQYLLEREEERERLRPRTGFSGRIWIGDEVATCGHCGQMEYVDKECCSRMFRETLRRELREEALDAKRKSQDR